MLEAGKESTNLLLYYLAIESEEISYILNVRDN